MRRREILRSAGVATVAGLAGCTGGGGSSTPTGTPTPPEREFPYTASSPSENVNPRDLTINNRTPQEYEVSVVVTDTGPGRTVLERTVTVSGESEHVFEDIIGKTGTYRIAFELAVGTSKRYKWPIDSDHGDAGISIAEGETPTQPVIWFSITRL